MAIGGSDMFSAVSPGESFGQVFLVAEGSAATLMSFGLDNYNGKECSSGFLRLLEGSNPQDGKSSPWTVLGSAYAEVNQGSVEAYLAHPLKGGGVYAVVFTPNCSSPNSTASIGTLSSNIAEDLGFGHTIGTVSGMDDPALQNLLFVAGASVIDATLSVVHLD